MFKKEETVDIFDRFGEHSTTLEEEVKHYNKQLEVFLNKFSKTQA